ncbi:MAG: hypothetical protein OEL57_10230 [Trichlorobacter sp.]|uniref:hypothetical protein n=1 Tax=Trichlorobacter sp. TaxID=2911007 RepID=UPI00256E3229|nr:hypothetical protein [Trichlorobacter sp.]MDK9718263.1 hypothetical protein [Trichlorobacter sp.]
MTPREEAIKRLREDSHPLPEGEPFTVDFYKPEDGYGVARLMYSVYGDGYPIDTYYIPDQLTEENRAGRIRSVVARTDSGQVVCHEAFYRSSAPNPDLYEMGLGLTLPTYRGSLAFARCTNLLISLVENGTIKAIYGEAVCNHTITQKVAGPVKFIETGVEVDLMPATAYAKEQASDGRVSCLMYFRIGQDQRRPLYLPDCYAEQIRFMMEGVGIDRELIQPASKLIHDVSELEIEQFDAPGVCRCTINRPGNDLAQRLAALEQELCSKNYALLQCFVPLGAADAAASVAVLRSAGFFLGGFLPAWFGEDGLLMQKLYVEPGFDSIKLYSERAKAIMELVRADWKRSKV